MRSHSAVFVAYLLQSSLSPVCAEERASPLVGVIRWGGYNGSPVTTQKQKMRFLIPEKLHSRAPWFFRRTDNAEHPLELNPTYDKNVIHDITEQKIKYAADAGIDYWAMTTKLLLT